MNPILAQNASALLSSHFDANLLQDVNKPFYSPSSTPIPPSPIPYSSTPTQKYIPTRTPTPTSSSSIHSTTRTRLKTPKKQPTTPSSSPSLAPLLFELEVNLPGNVRGVIRVHAGATSRRLAHEFAVHHRLSTELVDVLEQMIDQQTLAHTKKKIEENAKVDPFGGKIVKR
jgi:hypothetical protein